MQAIIFIGIQGAGKSTFYQKNFQNTHIRINLDMLKTRHREQIFLQACLEAKQPFVIDNTNPTPADRTRYIIPAKANKFQVIAYYFDIKLEQCKQQNNQRPQKQIIPIAALLGTCKKLTLPSWEEGFNKIYSVLDNYSIEEWKYEI
jgi:predicted kinase